MKRTDPDLANFNSWYAEILESLYPTRNAGLVIFMVTLPLLERYVRQCNGVKPDQDLGDPCMQTIRKLFPALPDLQTTRNFWNVYRNGFLHQATVSPKTRKGVKLPGGWLSHDHPEAVKISPTGIFWVNPVLFSKLVIEAIHRDFPTYAGIGTSAPALPSTVVHIAPKGTITIPPTYIGTGGNR